MSDQDKGVTRPDGQTPRITPVILSGGTGSRLWPLSRESYPKQLWPLLSGKTLLQSTALRAQGPNFTAPIIVSNEAHRFIIAEQMRAIGVENAHILLEPEARNSAPALTAAAFVAIENDPEAILWVMPADAAISDNGALHRVVDLAARVVAHDVLITFGIQPSSAETGYGYIERGEDFENIPGVFRANRFTEKPSKEHAKTFLETKRYFWNSGMFFAKAYLFLDEMRLYQPQIYAQVEKAVKARTFDMDFERLNRDDFCQTPNLSIDYAIAEKTKRGVVIPAEFGWSDIGSWDALRSLSPQDAQGNACVGDVFVENSQNCYVRGEGILTAVTGVEDLIVVATTDAVLVTHREKTQTVKNLVTNLINADRGEALRHNRHYRPWGYYDNLVSGDRFHVKTIVVKPGHKLSLQKHFHRSEHWVVVEGTARVTRELEEFIIHENESIYLPLGAVHRLENPGKIPLTLIEVQSGAYLSEDDIVRLDDTYHRDRDD